MWLDGESLASLTHEDELQLSPENIGGSEIEVSVIGKGNLYYYWSAEGVPVHGRVPERDRGIKVRRRLLSRDNKPLDLGAVAHGEIAVVEITVQNERPIENLVISDLLPAGFEIENPRLSTRDAEIGLGPGSLGAERVEMRDDRLLVFADLDEAGTYTYRYVVRAVTAGRFLLPSIDASCMYSPAISSVHGAGEVRIVRDR